MTEKDTRTNGKEINTESYQEDRKTLPEGLDLTDTALNEQQKEKLVEF